MLHSWPAHTHSHTQVHIRLTNLEYCGSLKWWCMEQLFEQSHWAVTRSCCDWMISISFPLMTDNEIGCPIPVAKCPSNVAGPRCSISGPLRIITLLGSSSLLMPCPGGCRVGRSSSSCSLTASHPSPHALTHPHSSETPGDGGEYRWGVSSGWCGGWEVRISFTEFTDAKIFFLSHGVGRCHSDIL